MSMKSKTILYFGLVEITFEVPGCIFKNIKEQDNHIKAQAKEVKVRGNLKLIKSNHQFVKYDGKNNISVFGQMKYFKKGTSLYYIGEYLAECLLIEASHTLLVHAAALYNPDTKKSIILFGEKGAGKTTVALRLCIEHGYHLIGNDQIIFGLENGELFTYAGTANFNIRRTAILSDDLLHKLFGSYFSSFPQSARISWDEKISVSAKELGVLTCHSPANVSKIYYIKTDKKQEGTLQQIWDDNLACLILNELLGRHISAQVSCFQSDEGNYFSAMPLIRYQQNNLVREKIVKTILKKYNIYKIAADTSEKIVKEIVDEMNSE
ncbi:serine/threonine protein kinase [Streptococcus porcinus]